MSSRRLLGGAEPKAQRSGGAAPVQTGTWDGATGPCDAVAAPAERGKVSGSNRRGWVLLPVLVCLGAAGLLLAGIQGERSARERELARRQARIQGREFALGARALPVGASVAVGRWEVARAADDACRACGPLGTYRIADGGERWEPAP